MKHRFIFLYCLLCFSVSLLAQTEKVQNRPYIDQRKWHYGFMIGFHSQDLHFQNNGVATSDGQTWFADVPQYDPGLSVGVVGERYLTPYLSLRTIPSMHFGSKNVTFIESGSGETTIQQIKSTYISMPVDLKYSSIRVNNHRPYVMVGVNPMYDLSIKKNDLLKLKPADCYLEVGVGCDFYLPFFKLIPELKFCFGLANVLDKDRTDLNDKTLLKYTNAVDNAKSRMIVLSFYFE